MKYVLNIGACGTRTPYLFNEKLVSLPGGGGYQKNGNNVVCSKPVVVENHQLAEPQARPVVAANDSNVDIA